MTAAERRAQTRERVKRWKRDHEWSMKQQRKRRYARQKAAKQASARGVLIELVVREKAVRREVQETFYCDLEGVDIAYDGRGTGQMAGAGDRAERVMALKPDNRRGTGDGAEEDDRGGAEEGAPTVEERRVREWLARKTGPGVEVELEL